MLIPGLFLTSPYQIPCFQFFSLLNLLVIPLFVILVTLTLTCSIFSFPRWKEYFAYLWGLLLGSRQTVHAYALYACLMCVYTLGVIVGIKTDSICICFVCICTYDVCIYFQRPEFQKHPANVTSHYSLLCLSESALCPARHLLSLSEQTWSFSVLPWRVAPASPSPFRKTPWPHHERE